MKFQAAVLATIAVSVSAHGHLHSVNGFPSRTQVAYENGEDTCPHCVLEDVADVGEPGRVHPGNRPFAEPGAAPINMGPCGMQNSGAMNNYNTVDRSWGNVVGNFVAGDVISFDSCWSQDHHGAYSLRVCENSNLVAPFIDASHVPSQTEMEQLEACFQDGVLPCAGIPSNEKCDAIAYGSGCQPGWGCATNTDWFYSGPRGSDRDVRCNRAQGTTNSVQLPPNFRSNHTLLSWRWDALNTAQVYTSCVDVSIE